MSNLDRFEDVFNQMTNTVVSQADRIARVEKKVVAETEEEGVTRSLDLLAEIMDHVWERVSPLESLLEQVVDNLYGLLGINEEMVSDQARKDELNKVKRDDDDFIGPRAESVKPEKEEVEGFLDGLFGSLSNISFRQFLTAAMIAPFAYKFTESFVGAITDEMVELTPAGVTGLAAGLQVKYSSMFTAVTKPFTSAVNSIIKSSGFFANIGDRIQDGFTSIKASFMKLRGVIKIIKSGASLVSAPIVKFGGMLRSVGGFIAKTFSMIPGSGAMKLLLGRLAWPITAVLGIVQAVKDYINTDGSQFEKFEAAIAGLFGEIVGAPLNLLGDIVGWVLKKLGFVNAGQKLADFNFKETIDTIFSSMFGMITAAVDWVKKLFTNPVAAMKDLWKAALGGYKSFLDILWSPIDKAVQWISGVFGWEEGKDFSLTDFVWGTVSSAWNWVKKLFTNPLGALKDYWNTYVGAWQDIGEFIWDGIKDAWDWISGKFGNFGSSMQTKWNDLLAAAGVESLMGLLWSPISSAWDWITEKFGWSSDDAPEVDLGATLKSWVDDLKTWVQGIFPDLPSSQQIAEAFYNSLPAWLQKVVRKVGGVKNSEDIINERTDQLSERLGEAQSTVDRTQAQIQSENNSSQNMQRALEEEIAAESGKIARSGAGENVYWGDEESGREKSRARIAELRSEQEQLRMQSEQTQAELLEQSIAAQEAAARTQAELNTIQSQPPEVAAARIELENVEAQKQRRLELQTLIGDNGTANPSPGQQSAMNELNRIPTLEELDAQMQFHKDVLGDAVPGFSKGSKGFVDFGKGTMAMLHHKEAVVPSETPAGKFLAEYFDDAWKPKLSKIAEAAGASSVVTNNNMAITKQRFVSESAQQSSIEQARAQRAITNIAPSIMSSRPTTNNNTSTTIINNNSPSRSLDDPSMLK